MTKKIRAQLAFPTCDEMRTEEYEYMKQRGVSWKSLPRLKFAMGPFDGFSHY